MFKQTKITSFFQQSPTSHPPENKKKDDNVQEGIVETISLVDDEDDDMVVEEVPCHETPAKRKEPPEETDCEKVEDGIIGMKVRTPNRHSG